MLIIGCDGVVSLENKVKQMDGIAIGSMQTLISIHSNPKTHTIGHGTLCIH